MTTHSLLKQIKVTDFALLKSGLEIDFFFNCEEKYIEFNPVQTCRILGKTGMIEAYRVDDLDPDTVLYVTVETKRGNRNVTWDQFVIDSTISGYMAKVLAGQWLQEQARHLLIN